MSIPFRRDRDRSRSPHPFPTSSQSPLNRVRQGLNKIRDEYNFIPKDKLDELLTRQTVKEITKQISNQVSGDQPRHLPANAFLYEDDYTRIHEKYRVILAILIELSWEELFFKFQYYDYDDLRLPFTQKDLEHISRDGAICPLFLKRQYEFLPRTIGEESGEGRHSWTSEYVLPFIAKTEIGGGGFSKVFKTKIHPLYDKINWTYFDEGRDHVYALKQLRDNSNEDAFMLEAFAGRLLGKRRHTNLLPLLAYFKHGSSFNMIFPYADCDLMTYYKTRSPPKTVGERLQFMQQIHKLTSALKAIHMGYPDQTPELLVLCGYHRDLKPQNILIFDGSFMISDFGLTRFRERNPHDQNTDTGVDWDLGSSTYRAPECDKVGVVKVGRAGDVWSLGCILAEVITFVLGGKDGVWTFMEYRK
ncbi:kinase-like protein, partial [Wilcoxina mikolae CBS 423.85]